MSVQHTITRSYKDQSSQSILLTETPTGNAELNLDDAALAVGANFQYHIAVTVANLQSCVIYASGAVTLYTNNPSGSSPQDTIPLSAGQAYCWTRAGDGAAKIPFSGNVTSFYVTNAGGGPVAFKFRALLNQ
jgi:hypothetical protein